MTNQSSGHKSSQRRYSPEFKTEALGLADQVGVTTRPTGRCRGLRRGRELRSWRAPRPPLRYSTSHL